MLVPFSVFEVEKDTKRSWETLTPIYQSICCYPQKTLFHKHHCENSKSLICIFFYEKLFIWFQEHLLKPLNVLITSNDILFTLSDISICFNLKSHETVRLFFGGDKVDHFLGLPCVTLYFYISGSVSTKIWTTKYITRANDCMRLNPEEWILSPSSEKCCEVRGPVTEAGRQFCSVSRWNVDCAQPGGVVFTVSNYWLR